MLTTNDEVKKDPVLYVTTFQIYIICKYFEYSVFIVKL